VVKNIDCGPSKGRRLQLLTTPGAKISKEFTEREGGYSQGKQLEYMRRKADGNEKHSDSLGRSWNIPQICNP